MAQLDEISLDIIRNGIGVRRFELTSRFETPLFCDNIVDFNQWFSNALYNDKRIYYTGIALSATIPGKVIGNHTYELYRRGYVHLLQKKVFKPGSADAVFNYYVYRTRNPLK